MGVRVGGADAPAGADRPWGRIGVYPGSFNPPTVAHLAIAEAAVRLHRLDRIDLALSRRALDKEHVERPDFADRVAVLEAVAASRPWLGVSITEAQLLVDIAEGYDLLVMGADKWAQVNDRRYYGDSDAARDDAVRRLPVVAVVARPPHPVPAHLLLDVDTALHTVSSSEVRAGRHEWMALEAAEFDHRTGAWSDPQRYERWTATTRGRPGGSS